MIRLKCILNGSSCRSRHDLIRRVDLVRNVIKKVEGRAEAERSLISLGLTIRFCVVNHQTSFLLYGFVKLNSLHIFQYDVKMAWERLLFVWLVGLTSQVGRIPN